MKKLPVGLWSYPYFSFCPTLTKNIHRANLPFVIAGFSLELNENCILQGHYTASSGNSVPTFGDNLLFPSSKVKKFLEDGTDWLSRNVGKRLPL
jgi:hypothetical protein